MITHEEEARQKWCPMSMAPTLSHESASNRSRDGDMRLPCRCVASDCMMWRWAMVDVEKSTDDEFAPAREWIERVPSATHGYCGLAGKPT